ncbi:putative phosphatidylinositol 3-kinase [Trypanosoma conorhini]|uniref:Putative phosphatidylinositol 3-kinase n=1 Tax=Trypanosoma conorhini TaxID=83891 RepID=A0A3R7MK62_9TRYP|nr:putative phosphatidylinositol 3-kinase [Trypanosoma conorhini]RNF16455.1 putative phosphatidylinositol 3-kinase [Trypanosoma conorhini]
MSGVRELAGYKTLTSKVVNCFTHWPSRESFALDVVLSDACKRVNVSVPSAAKGLAGHKWWEKLCNACADKPSSSSYGRALLRQRLVHALSERLAVDEVFRLNGHEIEKENIVEPIVVMGLPRCNGHQAAHVLSRSGLFLAFKQSDTFAPSLLLDVERRDAFDRQFKWFASVFPDFRCVRTMNPDQIDDDLTLQLMCPESYAWGLLHGLDEYLLECLQEDQTPVYQHLRRMCQLFQWYRRCGHFSECVLRDINPINNPIEEQKYGPKSPLLQTQWLLFCPFAILNVESLHDTFPDMKLIWVHRALSQCLPSLCSSLAIHNSLYTGKSPSDSQLVTLGDKVLGTFGSGTEYAIDYLADFDKTRMVHWSNRDVKRHTTRLATKTLQYFGIDIDRYRRMQVINAQTEYTEVFRPLHDSQMPYFGLHNGIISEVFDSYIYQFEEFAYEKKFGVTVEDYQPLAAPADQQSLGSLRVNGGDQPFVPSFADGQPMSDHFLQEGKGFK